MKRPVVLISVLAGVFLIAGAGASAHTVQLLTNLAGTHSSSSNDEASGARTESPKPSERPEASPTAEPTEKPESTEKPEPAETDPETADANDSETGDNEGDHKHGADHESGGGGDD